MWLNSTTNTQPGLRPTKTGSGMPPATARGTNWFAAGRWQGWLLVWGLCLSLTQSWAQGYIYVHKKTLSEESSVNFNFTGSGGIGSFTLNDQPTAIQTEDIGSSATGRLWAVATPAGGGAIYYRDVNSSSWVQTPTFGATAIDGDVGDGNVHINQSGTVYRFTSPSTVSLIGSPGNYGGQIAVDVASSQQGTIVITTLNATIWKWVSGTTWTQLSAINGFRIDASPVNGDIVFASGNGVYRSNSSGGAVTSLGNPTGVAVQASDVAYDANGAIYALVNSYVYRWVSGTTWVQEPTSAGLFKITGGVNGQLWGLNNGVKNIFSRTANGIWIDDERVRIGTNDNSQLIPVTAGTYTLTETLPSGWALQDIALFDPTNNSTSSLAGTSATLNVANGEVVHVVFQNGLVQTFAITNNCGTAYKEDFGTGSTGTLGAPLTGQTSYHYVGAGLVTDGYYAIVSQAGDIGSYAVNLFDHTSGNGTGRMMAINAAFDRGEFFRRRFSNLIMGATYNFSAWVASITNGGIQPNVQFEVRDATTGALLNSTTTGNISPAGVWRQGQLIFQAASTQIDLVLRNNNDGGSGNDLALDDITFSLAKDLGDAPNSYATTLASNGPCHGVVANLRMGSLIDSETDGFPATAGGNAVGDDSNNSDDEDGVTFLPLCTGNSTYSAVVTVTNAATPSARLIAWVDFNHSGTFEASEAATIAAGTSGTYTLTWSGLSGLTTGLTYARVRLTSDPSITVNTPGGSATDGEVEDYQLTIVSGGGTVTASATSLTTCTGDLVSINYTTAPITGQTVRWTRMPGNVTGLGTVSEALSNTTTAPLSYTYTALIADVYGCPSTAAVTVVTVNPRPTVVPSVCSLTICSGQTGNITFTPSIPGSTIHWTRTPTTPAPSSGTGDISQVLTNTGPTSVTYTYQIWADSPAPASCPSSTTITCEIVVTPGLTVLASANSTSVCVGSPLSLSAGVTPAGSYSYTWAGPNGYIGSGVNPQVSATAALTQSGSYTVTVTDASGCSGTATVDAIVIDCTVPCNLTVTASASQTAVCVGSSVTLSASVSPAGSYTYSWSGPNGFTSNQANPSVTNIQFSGEASALYTVLVTDANGCTATYTVPVLVQIPNVVITSNSPQCTGNTLSFSATGGMSSYAWTGPNGFSSNHQNPTVPNATTAATGSYSLTVTDANGCTATFATSATIAQQPSLTVTASASQTICSGQSTTLSVGGNNGSGVTWSNSLGQNGTGTSISFAGIRNLGTQPLSVTYVVEATAGSCTDQEVFVLTVNPEPVLQVVPSAAVYCNIEQVNIQATVTPGTATISWTRSPGGTSGGPTAGTVTVQETLPASVTPYQYTFTATGTNGCSAPAMTIPVTVQQ